MKTCKICNIYKSKDHFSKHKDMLDGHINVCKQCRIIQQKNYKRTRNGLVTEIYSGQKKNSIKRGHTPPSYTKQELKEWLFSNASFEILYREWEINNYDKSHTPSCDRLDDYAPYTFDNIRLVDWKTNCDRGCRDRRNGINNKQSIGVAQYTLDGVFINEYPSFLYAYRETNISATSIAKACRGIHTHAGGFLWSPMVNNQPSARF